MRVAVIGAGIAGNGAAWALKSAGNDVVVYEKAERPGGHSWTETIDYDGQEMAVDTGFIVYNNRNYPELTALFELLGVATEISTMTFAVSHDHGRREWSSRGLTGVFSQKRNLVSPSFLWMLRNIHRFNSICLTDREAGRLHDKTLGDYLSERRFKGRFLTDYLVPMGAAIWSTPVDRMLEFPALSFVNFFSNHRLLNWFQPEWRTVTGGSREYVSRLTACIGDGLRVGTPVRKVLRTATSVQVIDEHGHGDLFDQVILATHSDEALGILDTPSDEERSLLGALQYRPNAVYLHRDPRLMPRRRRSWASWNYLSWPSREHHNGDVAVTYWMNSLQNLDPERPVFVSLNPPFAPDPELTFKTYSYAHPQFDQAAMDAQTKLAELQGTNRTWFCGAYHGYGFHEDGLRSGLDVAEMLGADIPWRRAPASVDGMLQAAE